MIIGLTQRMEKLESKVNLFNATGSSQPHAQTMINSHNVSAITFRTGNQVQGLEDGQKDEDKEDEVSNIFKSGGSSKPTKVTLEKPTITNDSRLVSSILLLKTLLYLILLLFPIQIV